MGMRQRLRYRFDNWMARGVGAQILLLALFTIVLVLIGYRLASLARDPERGFGVVVNPSKRAAVPFGDGDKIIVLAES